MREFLVGETSLLGAPVEYYLLAEEYGTQGESYGVRIQKGKEGAIVRGITWSQRKIMALLAVLIKCAVTPTTLRDVVDDWLLA